MKWIVLLLALPIFSHAQVNKDLLDEINAQRKKRFLPALEYTDKHQPAADSWAKALVAGVRHSRTHPYYGECVSRDAPREDIIPDFMASKGHRRTLMDRKANKVCISVYEKEGIYYTVIRTFR